MNSNNLKRAVILEGKKLTSEQQRMLKFAIGTNNAPVRTIIPKLTTTNAEKTESSRELPKDIIRDLSFNVMQDVADIRAIQRSLPEVDTAKDILVSSILSPHDMVTEEIVWTMEGDFPSQLGAELMSVVRTHFEDEIKINEHLSTYLGNALFDRGSHILAVFPESGIDDVINNRTTASLESIQQVLKSEWDVNRGRMFQYGILGKGINDVDSTPVVSNESFFFGKSGISYEHRDPTPHSDIIRGYVTITDNPNVIRMPELAKLYSKSIIDKRYRNYSQESIDFNFPLDKEESKALPIEGFYKNVTVVSEDGIATMPDRVTASRKSIGHPLVLDIPHESCIPVFTPGNEKDHVGYLIILDQNGSPVTYISEKEKLDAMEDNFQQWQLNDGKGTGTQLHNTIQDLSELVAGKECDKKNMTLTSLRKFYTQLMERDLVTRFNNGVYGDNVQIPHADEIYNIMLARTLAGSLTQILYVPASLVTYIAFNYNEFGIGESLITRAKNLASLRIATLYANHAAMIKNATGIRQLTIELDPDVNDGEERIAKIVNRYLETNSETPLFHTYDPRKIGEALFRSSIELVVEGNEAMDQTKVSTEYKSSDRQMIDQDFMDGSKRDFINALQVLPQLFDDSEQPQFSSEFVTKNVLYLKRNMVRAKTFNAFIKDHVTKYVLNDGTLIAELSKIIRQKYTMLSDDLIDEANKANSTVPIIESFLDDLYPAIPMPDNDSSDEMKNAYSRFKQKVEDYIPVLFDRTAVGAMIRESDPDKKKEIMGDIEELVKNLFLSDWIKDNNVFPEFEDMFFIDGKPNEETIRSILDGQDTLSNMIGTIVNSYFERANPPEDSEGSGDTTESTPATGEDDGFSTDTTEEESTEDESTEETDEESDEDNEEEEEKDDEDEEDEKDDSEEESSDDDAEEEGSGEADDAVAELEKLDI